MNMYNFLLISSLFLGSAFGLCPESPVEAQNITVHAYYGELFYNSPNGIEYATSVALLNKWFALTAASPIFHHYKLDPNFHIQFNNDYVMVEKIHIHPDYSHFYQTHDVAIAEFSFQVNFDEFLQPIPLITAIPPENSDAIALGKFDNSIAYNQVMHLEIVDISICNTELGLGYETELCARVKCDAIDKKYHCRKGIGGPLVVDEKLAGIMSKPSCQCGKINHPTVFSNVVDNLDFINEIINVEKP